MTRHSPASVQHAAHRRGVFLMIACALLWSTAGVVTRQLDSASGFEVTFWRSAFAALFVGGYLLFARRSLVNPVRAAGRLGLFSGLMWAIMFSCFMLALTMTTVANTLIVSSIAPAVTALLTWVVLRQTIALRTWLTIAVASVGLVWMFAHAFDAGRAAGMLIALGVPLSTAVNVIAMKKAGHSIDLVPAVLLGALLSALAMWPLAMPLQASTHDILMLAMLGFFQLGLPCMLMVHAARALSAPEVALLALLEVVLGPLWAWLGAGEIPAGSTLTGGAIVILALGMNEVLALRRAPRRILY